MVVWLILAQAADYVWLSATFYSRARLIEWWLARACLCLWQTSRRPLSQIFNLWECHVHQHLIGQRWSHGQFQGIYIRATPGYACRFLSRGSKIMQQMAIFHSLGWMSFLWRRHLCPPHHKATVCYLVPEAVFVCSLFSPLLWAFVALMHSKAWTSTWLINDEQNSAPNATYYCRSHSRKSLCPS